MDAAVVKPRFISRVPKRDQSHVPKQVGSSLNHPAMLLVCLACCFHGHLASLLSNHHREQIANVSLPVVGLQLRWTSHSLAKSPSAIVSIPSRLKEKRLQVYNPAGIEVNLTSEVPAVCSYLKALDFGLSTIDTPDPCEHL